MPPRRAKSFLALMVDLRVATVDWDNQNMNENQSTEQSYEQLRSSTSASRYALLLLILAIFLFAFWYASRPGSVKGAPVDVPAALAEAASQNKPVLLKFHAEWCSPCRWMAKEVFAKDSVRQALADWIVVEVDSDANRKLITEYGVLGVPAFVVLSPQGQEIGRWQGPLPAEQMLAFLRSVRAKMKSAS